MDIRDLNIRTMAELKREYEARNPNGMYFNKKSMEKLNAKITARTVYGGRYFVEQVDGMYFVTEAYMARDTIRFTGTGRGFATMDAARDAAKRLAGEAR